MRTIDFLTDWKNGNNGIYTGVIWYLALMIGSDARDRAIQVKKLRCETNRREPIPAMQHRRSGSNPNKRHSFCTPRRPPLEQNDTRPLFTSLYRSYPHIAGRKPQQNVQRYKCYGMSICQAASPLRCGTKMSEYHRHHGKSL